MSTSELKAGEAVRDVHFSDDTLSVDLVDGRTITVPLVWYPRLLQANPEQRSNWEIVGLGMESTGPTLTKTSAQKAFSGVPLHQA